MTTDKAAAFLAYWRMIALATRQSARWPWPEPEPEFTFHPRRKWRFDWAWPQNRVAVEVDGGQYAFRGGRHATDADREKINNASSLGWRVLRFSPQQLERDPQECIDLVRAALEWDHLKAGKQ